MPARGRGGSCPGPQCGPASMPRPVPARWPAAIPAPCSPPRSPRQPCPRCSSPRKSLQHRACDQPSKHFWLRIELAQQVCCTSTSVQEEGRALTIACRRCCGVERNRAHTCGAAPGAPRQPHRCHSAHLLTQSFITPSAVALLVRRKLLRVLHRAAPEVPDARRPRDVSGQRSQLASNLWCIAARPISDSKTARTTILIQDRRGAGRPSGTRKQRQNT